MVLDTNIKKAKKLGNKQFSGRLALRILAINLIVPVTLALSLFYMSQYRRGIIETEVHALQLQTSLFAAALAEEKTPEEEAKLLRRFTQITKANILLFDPDGHILKETETKIAATNSLLSKEGRHEPSFVKIFNTIDHFLFKLPLFPASINNPAQIKEILYKNAAAWSLENSQIIFTAAAPVQAIRHKDDFIILALREGSDINTAMGSLQFNILILFLSVLSMTLLLSVYLSETIAQPLKKLAHAAEEIRHNKGEKTDIPDMSARHDEIGALSVALQDMTQELYSRLDSIENFAADVAHELKNPLTSLRSAIETLEKVKTKADQEKLYTVIQHDIQRMNRLITDISATSRLDAELGRAVMGKVDLKALLKQISAAYNHKNFQKIIIDLPTDTTLPVHGNEGRLEQVFDNLLTNALSFSPSEETVTITATKSKENIQIQIIDKGPGIPDTKLDTIFERFYTQRPDHEAYGEHSGLGLFIAQQIITAHNGEIHAENTLSTEGNITGTCFTVTLKRFLD